MYEISRGVTLVLASASPRRRQMFNELGLAVQFAAPDIDETPKESESAIEMVERLALAKARKAYVNHLGSWCLAADTTVVREGRIFGKPENRFEAFQFLKDLSGAVHQVVGALALVGPNGEVFSNLSVSEVELGQLSDDEISAYINTGEPFDKAGGYAIQGIGSAFVNKVSGSYTNVVGLDLVACIRSLKQAGVITLARTI